MKHLIFFSGGIGSWKVADIVSKKHASENTYCMFTDTLIEDNDLYRFMLEAWSEIYKKERPVELIKRAKCLFQPYQDMDIRKEQLESLRVDSMEYFNNVIWLSEHMDVWDIYKKTRFLGNSRIAKCSHVIKQDLADKYVRSNFSEEDTILYLGIDWTEVHRKKGPLKNWQPYKVEFPLCDEHMVFKEELFNELDKLKIKVPELYELGFSHNNCGGFCCRAGQGHFLNLLKQKPELYSYHENKEKEFIDYIGKDVSILKRTVNKQVERLTLEKLRSLYETGKEESIDKLDMGGCGCFLED